MRDERREEGSDRREVVYMVNSECLNESSAYLCIVMLKHEASAMIIVNTDASCVSITGNSVSLILVQEQNARLFPADVAC